MGLKNNFTLIFCLFYLGVFVAGTKETFEDLDKLLNDPNIWQYIEKRVGKNGKDRIGYDDENGGIPVDTSSLSKHPSFSPVNKDQTFPEPEETNDPLPNEFKTIADSSGNTCKYQQNNSMIIRSKTSLSKGAFYLKNAFGLTAEGCARKCCYTQNCNLAVYEDKEKHSCYLFDCGTPSKCTFAHHGNFSVMSFQNHNYEPHVHQQYHENELESLGETPRPTPPAPTTRKPIQDTPTPFQPKVKVPLYGDCNIDWGDQCGDRNAECRDEQCKCKHGYHAIYAYCRQICKDDEFQCKNKGQQGNVPDCIDNKHRCDGVPQCADGSDEDKCPDKSESDKETDTDENLKTGIDKVEKIEPDTSEEKPNLKPTANNIQDGSLNNVKHQEVEKEDKNEKEPVKENLIKTDQETEKESPKDEHQKPETKTSVTKTTKTPKTAQTQNLEGPEKVVVKSPTDSNQGPIVALALGLGICLMLLIFVGCRLRTVKRRIRRGKSLHSNEADYLINGMYL